MAGLFFGFLLNKVSIKLKIIPMKILNDNPFLMALRTRGEQLAGPGPISFLCLIAIGASRESMFDDILF